MTQTASISSTNKKKFLKKALKIFNDPTQRKNRESETQNISDPAKGQERP